MLKLMKRRVTLFYISDIMVAIPVIKIRDRQFSRKVVTKNFCMAPATKRIFPTMILIKKIHIF
jgi:hypothetical protein